MAISHFYGNNSQHTITIARKSGYTDTLVGSSIELQLGPRLGDIKSVSVSRSDGGIIVESEAEDQISAIATIQASSIESVISRPAQDLGWKAQVIVTPVGGVPIVENDLFNIKPTFA